MVHANSQPPFYDHPKGYQKEDLLKHLVSFARQHLFSYHKLTDLIEKIEKDWRKKHADKAVTVLVLFDG